MKLLLSQKNQLYDIIGNQDLTQNIFSYLEDEYSVKIKYNKDYEFKIVLNNPKYTYSLVYSPGENKLKEITTANYWVEVAASFQQWLEYLKKEIQLPDKWKLLGEYIKSTGIEIPSSSNEFFSINEYEILKERIEILKNDLFQIAELKANHELINIKIDQLLINSKKLNKPDWINLFLGTIFNLIITLSLNEHVIHSIWQLVKNFFNNFLILR